MVQQVLYMLRCFRHVGPTPSVCAVTNETGLLVNTHLESKLTSPEPELNVHPPLPPSPGGKTEDFLSAAKLFYRAKRQVKVPTYLVPATQKVWADVYTMPVPGCDGKTAAEIFEEAGCITPAAPSCAACLGGPRDTFARMNEPEVGGGG